MGKLVLSGFIAIAVTLFLYGLFLPGLFPGLYYTMAGGFILGSTIAIWQEL